MNIEIGAYYANDNETDFGMETNVMLVLSKRKNSEHEVDSYFYITETMFLEDGKIKSIHKSDWLPEFIERRATNREIELFKEGKRIMLCSKRESKMNKLKKFLLRKVTIELPIFLMFGIMWLVLCGIYYSLFY